MKLLVVNSGEYWFGTWAVINVWYSMDVNLDSWFNIDMKE